MIEVKITDKEGKVTTYKCENILVGSGAIALRTGEHIEYFKLKEIYRMEVDEYPHKKESKEDIVLLQEEVKNCIVHSPYFNTTRECCKIRDDVMNVFDKHIRKI